MDKILLLKKGVNVRIQTENLSIQSFKPFSPLVEIFYNPPMFEIDIGVHANRSFRFSLFVIMWAQPLLSPDLVDPTLLRGAIVVSAGEVVPMPVEVIIGAISAIKGEFGPSLNGEGLSENLCFDPDRP